MSNLTIRRPWLQLLIGLYVVASFLFVVDIVKYGDGDARGPLIMSVVIGIFFIPLARGYVWAKWTLVVIFIALSILIALGYDEHRNIESLVLIGCYALLAYLSYRLGGKSKRMIDNAVSLQDDVLDSSLINTSVQAQGEAESRYRYPVLITRYKASLIDGFIFFFTMIEVMVIFDESTYRPPVMISLALAFVFLYQPLLTVYSATIGQRIMNIRVRSHHDPAQRIQLWQAYVRVVLKTLLGWVSVLSIHMNDEHRAIHDLAGMSVVVENEPPIQQ
jgi:hypothetical protein